MKKGEIKMDYKEEYQKALERAKKGLPIDEVFPELKGSEDERIRKRIRLCLDECVHSDIIRDYERDECLAYLERQKERQPAEWSEEDEKIFNSLCTVLHGGLSSIPTEKFISWLKSRLSQPQKEWSEEDEKMLQHIVSDLREFRDCETDEELISDYEDEISWLKNRLKSLRPQPRWKPSEEQVEALKNSAYGTYQNGDGPALRELYEQLEKMI